MSNLSKKLQDLADEFNLPSITTWQKGQFIDGPKYKHMPASWKNERQIFEETLIRPDGGTNNALFQVTGYTGAPPITEYLEALGKLLREETNDAN